MSTIRAGPNVQCARAHARPTITSSLQGFFRDRSVIYSKSTTEKLTDFAGAFLIFCFALYFTIAGYLFYRELSLMA